MDGRAILLQKCKDCGKWFSGDVKTSNYKCTHLQAAGEEESSTIRTFGTWMRKPWRNIGQVQASKMCLCKANCLAWQSLTEDSVSFHVV